MYERVSELGGSVFYSCAAQLKSIISEKIGHVQELIDLDPHALDHGNPRPLKRGSAFTGKLGIKDFTLVRLLASGGFAQVRVLPAARATHEETRRLDDAPSLPPFSQASS